MKFRPGRLCTPPNLDWSATRGRDGHGALEGECNAVAPFAATRITSPSTGQRRAGSGPGTCADDPHWLHRSVGGVSVRRVARPPDRCLAAGRVFLFSQPNLLRPGNACLPDVTMEAWMPLLRCVMTSRIATDLGFQQRTPSLTSLARNSLMSKSLRSSQDCGGSGSAATGLSRRGTEIVINHAVNELYGAQVSMSRRSVCADPIRSG
jgi:hypothetical protein